MTEKTVTVGDTTVQIRETEDGFEAVAADDLPVFYEFQMVRKVNTIQNLTIYEDEEGDMWIEDSAGEAKAFCENVSAQALRNAMDDIYG